jgi:UDP-3-O-[3-hydroxymyristoyl] glucosamine N-acyltransferase
LVPIPIPEVSGTGIGTDTKIGENTGIRYFGKSTKIGTLTKIGKSTDFGREVPILVEIGKNSFFFIKDFITKIFTHFDIIGIDV